MIMTVICMLVFQSTKMMGGDQSQTHQPVQTAPDAFKTAHEALVMGNLSTLWQTFASVVSGINFPYGSYVWSGGYGFKDATITRCVLENPETHKKTEGFVYEASNVKAVFLANSALSDGSSMLYVKYKGKSFKNTYTLKELNVEPVGQPASLTVLKDKPVPSSQLDSKQPVTQKDGVVYSTSPALFKDQGVGKNAGDKFYLINFSIPKSFGDDILLEKGLNPDTYASMKLDRLEKDMNAMSKNLPTLLQGVNEVRIYSLANQYGSVSAVYNVGSRYLYIGGGDVSLADRKRLKDENTTVQVGAYNITAPTGMFKRTLQNGQSILVSSEELKPAATRAFGSRALLDEQGGSR